MKNAQRIILIDDNDDDNFYHRIVLGQAGFEGEILVFENGVTALQFFRTTDLHIPTLVFLDINMPMMDGFEVAERLEPIIADTRTIVVVMLTSSASQFDRERAGRLEVVHGFLTKPLTTATFKDLLAED